MGQVEDRWWGTAAGQRVRRDRYGRALRWRARYRDAEGRQRSRSFARKPDAVRFLVLVQADLLRDSYIDLGRSGTPLSVYATLWLESLSVRPTTRRTYDSHLRTWILPALGGRTLASITPTDVRALSCFVLLTHPSARRPARRSAPVAAPPSSTGGWGLCTGSRPVRERGIV